MGAKLTPARQRVVDVLTGAGSALSGPVLQREARVSAATVRRMHGIGLLEAEPLTEVTAPHPDCEGVRPELTATQRRAATEIVERVRARDARPVLLGGVTGSGKTEVYFEAVAACLASGRQVLVLLPEIALGPQWFARFQARFGTAPARWHSAIPAGERRRTWREVAGGTTPVVVGARSALFLPFPALGLIVVDEEHDTSYKQEDGVIYNARDMAVVRAAKERAAIVLASATPALETHVNAHEGRYHALTLPRRYGDAELPDVEAVDLRASRPEAGSWLAKPVVDAAAAALARDEQVLLFLNRRGYAPLTVCRTCGGRIGCTSCSTWLVEHRRDGLLTCHHCGHRMPVPAVCPHLRCRGFPGGLRTGGRTHRGRGAPPVPGRGAGRHDQRHHARAGRPGATGPGHGIRRDPDSHRHSDGGQGTPLPEPDHGRGGGRGPGAGGCRSPGRRADLPAADAGCRPGRPGGSARARADADLGAGASGHAGVSARGRGCLSADGGGRPGRGKDAAVRAACGADLGGRAINRSWSASAGRWPAWPRSTMGSTCLGRRLPRSAGFAASTGSGSSFAAGRNQLLQTYVRTWLGSVRAPAGIRIKVDVDPYSFL